MKSAFLRLFSTIILLMLFVFNAFSQTITKAEYEDLVDKIICGFADFYLKEQRNKKYYERFRDEVELNCNYFTVRPFLSELKPTPVQTLEIVNILHHDYKERYNSKQNNRYHYDILMDVFNEDGVQSFSRIFSRSFPAFKSNWEVELEKILITTTVEAPIIDDTISNTSVEDDYNAATMDSNTAEDPKDFNTDEMDELDSSNGWGNSFLLFGFLFLLIAYGLYFYYQRNKINGADAPPAPKPTITIPAAVVPPPSKPTPKSKNPLNTWFAPKKKEETYADKIAALQLLIQSQKNTLVKVKEEMVLMHQQMDALTDKVGFEVIEVHLEQLSKKLDEVEEKQKELISELDTHLDFEEAVFNDTLADDIAIDEASDTTILLDPTITKTTPSNFSNEIPNIQPKKLNFPPDVFFMPVPNKDGSFDARNWTAKFEDTESVYRFEIVNSYEAKFQFYNEKKTVKRAISGYDIYIKPVCKPLNPLNTNATEVITQMPGIVYRDGDVWRLKEKALIYYQ